MDERMHDRERRGDHDERRDRGRDPGHEADRPQYGGGWHRGSDYGPRGGYGRYDDRTEPDRQRMRERDERSSGRVERRYDRDVGDGSARGSSGRYDYADEGYGGAYRRDRDDRWRGGEDSRDDRRRIGEHEDRSGYERQGEAWRRDAAARGGRSRDANWGSAFDPGEHRRDAGGPGYGEHQRGDRSEERRGRPSDYDDARGGRFEYGRGDASRESAWRGDERRYDERRYDELRGDERRGNERRGRFDSDREDRWRSETRPRDRRR